MTNIKLHTYQIAMPEHLRIDGTNLQDFLASAENDVDMQIIGRENHVKSLTISTKDNEIYFCKRIMVKEKLVRRAVKTPPFDIGTEDEYLAWERVVMKKPCRCVVVGTKTLTNGIRHGGTDPKYDLWVPRFEPLENVQALLVVQGMNKAPFLIPYPDET